MSVNLDVPHHQPHVFTMKHLFILSLLIAASGAHAFESRESCVSTASTAYFTKERLDDWLGIKVQKIEGVEGYDDEKQRVLGAYSRILGDLDEIGDALTEVCPSIPN